MRRCASCDITVQSPGDVCPLCHVPLPEGERDTALYPPYEEVVRHRRENQLWRKIVRFLLVSASLICMLIDLLTAGLSWSLIVAASCAYFLIVEAWINARRAIGAKVLLPAIFMIVYLTAIDLITGYDGWSLDYIAPLILLATMLVMTSIVLARRLQWRDYLMFILALAGFSLIPLLLLLVGVIQVAWPTLVCLFTAAIALAAMFSFDRTMIAQIRRRMHM